MLAGPAYTCGQLAGSSTAGAAARSARRSNCQASPAAPRYFTIAPISVNDAPSAVWSSTRPLEKGPVPDPAPVASCTDACPPSDAAARTAIALVSPGRASSFPIAFACAGGSWCGVSRLSLAEVRPSMLGLAVPLPNRGNRRRVCLLRLCCCKRASGCQVSVPVSSSRQGRSRWDPTQPRWLR